MRSLEPVSKVTTNYGVSSAISVNRREVASHLLRRRTDADGASPHCELDKKALMRSIRPQELTIAVQKL